MQSTMQIFLGGQTKAEDTSQRHLNFGLRLVLFALLYILLAKFGLSLAFTTKQVSTIWPPSGVAMAVLLLAGYRYWPGILIGAFIANILTAEPAWVALIIGIGNTLEALTGAFLIRYLFPDKQILDKLLGIVGIVGLGAFLATTISATIGVATLAAAGLIDSHSLSSVWQTWWVGDMMGVLIILPLILSWTNKDYRKILWQRQVEASVLFLTCLLAAAVIFAQLPDPTTIASPLSYILFPIIIWAAVRFMQIGVVNASLIISLTAVWGTIHQFGPFANNTSIEKNLIVLQFFILILSVTALVLAVSVFQRMKLEEALRRQTYELQKSRIQILQTTKRRVALETQIKSAKDKISNILNEVLNDDMPPKS